MNRSLPDAELDAFVDALATRISGFDKWAIANTKRLVNTSLPPDVELGAGWGACIASLGRPSAQDAIKRLLIEASTSRVMSKIGWDTTWTKSRARRCRTCRDAEPITAGTAVFLLSVRRLRVRRLRRALRFWRCMPIDGFEFSN